MSAIWIYLAQNVDHCWSVVVNMLVELFVL